MTYCREKCLLAIGDRWCRIFSATVQTIPFDTGMIVVAAE
jgi:hypothetical protein